MKTTPPFLPLVRELVRTYQAFERVSAGHVRSMGLTPAQFDVVATLGNTQGMNPKQLGEKTLITKGTLTGVVDRLAEKGLVQRLPDPRDGRGQIVRLTAQGQALFETVFPAHVAHIGRALAGFDSARLGPTQQALHLLRQALEQAGGAEAEA
ncbi:MarR family winged helix-turn-helix transcriptional regulator [Thiomonas bhubaneswarensis]|uniref:Transcriptional regulator, MarR family n=1 Tax=Thiomonas bhubaneswarensis TaxID=339866 RepID=A0A0K6HRE8_9BURK|nr:MarR family transcriptional regulator [Thiomonas bhubaneswarensis]CUA93587.1 transcriptional regulator, MarR family [Thiomonas bhubaneswarensis]